MGNQGDDPGEETRSAKLRRREEDVSPSEIVSSRYSTGKPFRRWLAGRRLARGAKRR